jgi:hypothetical protein
MTSCDIDIYIRCSVMYLIQSAADMSLFKLLFVKQTLKNRYTLKTQDL